MRSGAGRILMGGFAVQTMKGPEDESVQEMNPYRR
jgi:hypothetical protein